MKYAFILILLLEFNTLYLTRDKQGFTVPFIIYNDSITYFEDSLQTHFIVEQKKKYFLLSNNKVIRVVYPYIYTYDTAHGAKTFIITQAVYR